MTGELAPARWIARAVPPGQRIVRQITASRVDWVEAGHTLGQTFSTEGPIVAMNLDLRGPGTGEEPFTTDVEFTISLETSEGDVIATRLFVGPQLVWDYFGALLDVTPAAPPGAYVAVLRVQRGRIGWSTADEPQDTVDDGVSPLPVTGAALADGQPAPGVRMLGVETMPAPNPEFRRAFELAGAAVTAELSACVLGIGVILINGVRVGEEMLEPAVTDYDKTLLYRTWDVAHLLRAGPNEIVIHAGRERYSARGGDVWGWNLAPWHREPVAIARLDAVETTGAKLTITTDESWTCTAGPVVAERLFRGEDWVVGDTQPDWQPAIVVEPPAGVLRVAEVPPVAAFAPRPARVVEQLDGSRTVYDFGEVMVGRIRCRVTGGRGGSVRVISGEQRSTDGSVICDNFLIAGEAQLDTLQLETSVEHFEWEPQFGYRGFRWMQVEVAAGAVVEEVRAIPLYTDLDEMGEFSASNSIVEWIDTATARTFRNNLHGIPTDTPIYEKNGWTADAHLATEGLLHHFDLRSSFGKWVDDHIDAQGDNGSIPQIIPTPGWARASDPTWSSSAVLIPWYLYREYGDLDILRKAAPMVRRFADHVIDELVGDLWAGRTWGDWLSPGYHLGPEGMSPIGSIMTVTLLQHTAAVLAEIGESDAETYLSAAERTGRAYHAKYFDPAAGLYAVPGVGYRQSMNILPLAFDVVPETLVATVRASLIEDIERRTGGHLDCGAVGVRHLLPVLSEAGRDDLAITVLTQRTPPGWGAWYQNGETTLLESWDPDARSRNHYFLGSVSAWIQQRIGALQLTEAGWAAFDIAPVDDPRITRARIRHQTPLGDAEVDWERGAGGWRFAILVPDGALGTIRVGAEPAQLGPGSHVVHVAA